MNCPQCSTINDNENVFCVSCGMNFKTAQPPVENLPPTLIGGNYPTPAANNAPPPTQFQIPANRYADAPESIPTAFTKTLPFNQTPAPNFNLPIPETPAPPQKKGNGKFVWLSAILILLLAGGGIGAYFLINKPVGGNTAAEVLPDHLGLFAQNDEKNNVTEIGKQDFANVVAAKDDLIKNDALVAVQSKPNLILYADGKDVPVGDLKLIQLDSVKDDGSLKEINFQAAPVDGKPEMKRLRVPEGLANGKYAFALFDGFLDDGKHKLWAFQVKNADKTDNGDLAKTMSLSIKSKSAASPTPSPESNTNQAVKLPPTPKPTVAPPSGGTVAYCRNNNVVLRGGASLTAKKVGALSRGQRVYILNYSSNYDYWNGMEGNWAYVQTEAGGRGWVFTPLLSY